MQEQMDALSTSMEKVTIHERGNNISEEVTSGGCTLYTDEVMATLAHAAHTLLAKDMDARLSISYLTKRYCCIIFDFFNISVCFCSEGFLQWRTVRAP